MKAAVSPYPTTFACVLRLLTR